MLTATRTLSVPVLRRALPLALALTAFVALAPRAHAAQLDQVVVGKPVVKVIGHDEINAPIEQVTVVARVIPDRETLTTDSGVKLLNDYIVEAARKACFAADPLAYGDGACVHDAVKSAKQQVPALVAHARSTAMANGIAIG